MFQREERRPSRRKLREEMNGGGTARSVTEDSDMVMAMKQELLPGLPNDVTLAHITTKVDWASVVVLSKVNHTWAQAIQDRLVYNARVLSHSTETYDVTYCSPPILQFYSRNCPRNRPRRPNRGPYESQFVALDGRVYSLGLWIGTLAVERSVLLIRYASAAVFVLDLAGCGKRWESCAPMQAERSDFVCGVRDGKVCVVGGWNGDTHVNTEEVYDPNTNAWSSMSIADDWYSGFRFQDSLDL